MPALSFTSLDRLIEPSGSSSKETASSSDCSTPFSFYPPLYTTPPQQRPPSPSPSAFSPSPYVLNFKRRGPIQQQVNAGKRVDASTDSSSSPFRMDADRGEDVKTVSAPLQKLLKNADSSPNENGLPVKSHEVLAENDVFEIELDRRDGSKIVPAFEKHGMVDNDNHFASDCSARKLHGPWCELQAGPSSVSSLAINEDSEFFDAPESVISDSASEDEISSLAGKAEWCVGGCSTRTPLRLEDEIRRRIKAEEAVVLWQSLWNEMAKRYSSIGLSISSQTGEFLGKNVDSLEVLNQELIVGRLVGGAIARAVTRAEKDEEFESVLAAKNRETSRLWDKVQYLELVNREMSQRNQEVIESTQRRRRRRQRRRKLALGGFCAAFCIGTAGLLCCKYIPWDHTKGVASLFENFSAGDSSLPEAASQ